MTGLQQAPHAADVDVAGSPTTAEHRHKRLVTDLGVQVGGGEVVAVPVQHRPPLHILLVGQISQDSPGRCQGRDGVALLAQRPVQCVGDPCPPRCHLGADRDVTATAGAARPSRARFEDGQPGEVEDVAQFAQLVVA